MKNIFEGLIFINGFVYKSKTSRALLRDLAGNSYYDKPLASSLCFVIDIIVIHFCGFPFFLFAFMTSIPEELLDQVDYLQRFHLSTRVTLMINGPSRLLIKSKAINKYFQASNLFNFEFQFNQIIRNPKSSFETSFCRRYLRFACFPITCNLSKCTKPANLTFTKRFRH